MIGLEQRAIFHFLIIYLKVFEPTKSHKYDAPNLIMVFLVIPPFILSLRVHMKIQSKIYHILYAGRKASPIYRRDCSPSLLFLWRNNQPCDSPLNHVHIIHKNGKGQYHSTKFYDLRIAWQSGIYFHSMLVDFSHQFQTQKQNRLYKFHLQVAISQHISQSV